MLQAFTKKDDVVLFVLSSTFYHSDKEVIPKQLAKFISDHIKIPTSMLPLVVFLPEEIPMIDMPKLYHAADAFVLPSRGEGWGLPYVEAMSMELPVLATNWSGNTEYMNEDNSYLISVKKLIKCDFDETDWSGEGLRVFFWEYKESDLEGSLSFFFEIIFTCEKRSLLGSCRLRALGKVDEACSKESCRGKGKGEESQKRHGRQLFSQKELLSLLFLLLFS